MTTITAALSRVVSRISSPSNKTFLRANVDVINVITRKKDNK